MNTSCKQINVWALLPYFFGMAEIRNLDHCIIFDSSKILRNPLFCLPLRPSIELSKKFELI